MRKITLKMFHRALEMERKMTSRMTNREMHMIQMLSIKMLTLSMRLLKRKMRRKTRRERLEIHSKLAAECLHLKLAIHLPCMQRTLSQLLQGLLAQPETTPWDPNLVSV